MRILHVVDSLNPGGMENGVVNMTNRLHGEHVISIACLRASGAFAARLPESCAVRVMGKQGGFSRAAVKALSALFREFAPDVVHTHNMGPLIYAALASRGGRTAALCHGEHSALRPDECTLRRRIQRRLLYRCCTTVHTVSRELTRQLAVDHRMKARGGIRTVINGVDCGEFAPAPDRAAVRRELGLPADGLILGIVGRIARTKRHALLLDAFDQFVPRHPDAHLLIVGGDGGEGERVSARAEASPFRGAITLAGFQAVPRPFYQAMDLLVIPSENEGLSNAMLEAMSCGVPVLSNRACGCAEVIEDGRTGFLGSIPDAASLAEVLAATVADRSRLREAGLQARAHVTEHYSIESMAAAYVALYEDCAARFRKR